MGNFHVNLKTGKVGACEAAEGNCPFKENTAHASTADQARELYERHIAQDDDPETNSTVSLKKAALAPEPTEEARIEAFSRDLKGVLAKIDQAEEEFKKKHGFSSKLLGAIGSRLDLTAFGVSDEKADEVDLSSFDMDRDAGLTFRDHRVLDQMRQLRGEARERATRGMTVSKVNYVEREGLMRLPGNTLSMAASIADNISEGKNVSDRQKIKKAGDEAERKLFEKLGIEDSRWL